jgi:hypothetical protein
MIILLLVSVGTDEVASLRVAEQGTVHFNHDYTVRTFYNTKLLVLSVTFIFFPATVCDKIHTHV